MIIHVLQPVDEPEAPAGTPEAVKQARAAAAAQHNARKVGLCRVMLGDFGIAKVFDAQVQQTSQQVCRLRTFLYPKFEAPFCSSN